MTQEAVWEKEYQQSKLVTKKDQPQNDVLRFLKYLKKDQGIELSGLRILDLGCGTGRNSNYLAALDNQAVGMDISATAIKLAKERAAEMDVKTSYLKQSIGESYPFAAESFDLLLDVTSSNSLNQRERSIYLEESHRVLKSGGYCFVRALCKEGDKNAQALLKASPGTEPDTYLMKDLGLTERVFSQQDFIGLYSRYFKILKLLKKTSYTRLNNQSYKRNFWLAYLQK